jgi:phosphohistidine phosphatase SixA
MTNNKSRTLILLRHGESHPHDGLTPLGVTQVKNAAKAINAQGLVPDLIVSSHPLRAQKTTQTLTSEFAKAVETIDHDLLNVHGADFSATDFLSALPQNAAVILLSGHGETMAVLLNDLLDDENCARLFACVPHDRKMITSGAESSRILSLMPRTADGVVLMEESNNWRFYGYIADGNIIFAKSETQSPSGTKASNSFLLSYRLS